MNAYRAAGGGVEGHHARVAIGRNAHGAFAGAAARIADDEWPVGAEQAAMEGEGDRHEIGVALQGDGTAAGGCGEQDVHRVVDEAGLLAGPAEDAAAQAAEIAFAGQGVADPRGHAMAARDRRRPGRGLVMQRWHIAARDRVRRRDVQRR